MKNDITFVKQFLHFSNDFDYFLVNFGDCQRFWTGLKQSMKPMIGKSIDQSMTIDALLVNWHRLASANRRPIDNHTKVVAAHRLPSIGVKKISVSHSPACTYTHSKYARMFEMIWICSPDCLYAVAWFQKSTTETHFETVFWRNTSQQHTFSLSCPFRCPLYCWYLVDMYSQEFYISTISPWCINHHCERNKVLSQFSSLIKRPCFWKSWLKI